MKLKPIDLFGVLVVIVAVYCGLEFADPWRADAYLLIGVTAAFVLAFGLAYAVSVIAAFFRWMGFVK